MKKSLVFIFLILMVAMYFLWPRGKPPVARVAVMVATPTPSPKRVYKAVKVPKRFKERVGMDSGFALGFAQFICGTTYTNYQAVTKALKNLVTPDLDKMFFSEFFTKDEIKEITDRKLIMSFKPSKPIKVIQVGETLDEFLVEGILTTKSDDPKVKTTNQAVAMIVGFSHGPKTTGLISYFEKVEPTDDNAKMAGGSDLAADKN